MLLQQADGGVLAGLCVCASGEIAVADSGNHVIRMISADCSTIRTIAGTVGKVCHPETCRLLD